MARAIGNHVMAHPGDLASRRLTLARRVWGVFFVVIVFLYLVSLPISFQHSLLLGVNTRPEGWTEADMRSALAQLGWPVEVVAYFFLGSKLLAGGLFFGTAALIFLRKINDGMGVYVPWVLTAFGYAFTTAPEFLLPAWMSNGAIGTIIGNFLFVQIFLLLYFFPDGRFVPYRLRWVLAAWLYMIVATALPSSALNPEHWPALPNAVFNFGLSGSLLLAALYRYFLVSSPAQRQQTKWVVLGLITALAGFIIAWQVIDVYYQPLREARAPQGLIGFFIIQLVGIVSFLFVPLTIAIAILRYRLWDIEVILRKTLFYAVLSALLALIYFGSVVLLQNLSVRLLGENSVGVMVISTLLIAAIFNPLRRRVQDIIDRRFFRRKYDLAQVADRFASTARDEVELDKLAAALLGLVTETMHPEQVSFWLAPVINHQRETMIQ